MKHLLDDLNFLEPIQNRTVRLISTCQSYPSKEFATRNKSEKNFMALQFTIN